MSTGIELPPPPPPLPEDGGRLTIPDAEFSASIPDSQERACPNCGAPVHGPFCYACGQSEKGMIRHLSEVLSDLADIVLNVDSRVFRSMWDLYVRPGFLTIEYLAGRRARYVTPFRLFFFLTIIAFFAMQVSFDPEAMKGDLDDRLDDVSTQQEVDTEVNEDIEKLADKKSIPGIGAMASEEIDLAIAQARASGAERLLELGLEGASSAEDVSMMVDESLMRLTTAMDVFGANAEATAELEKRRVHVRELGDARLQELREDAAALAAGKAVPVRKKKDESRLFDLDGKPWHPETNPFSVDWWSKAMNKKLNATAAHLESNIRAIPKNPGPMLAAWFSVLPQTLFVVMPLFAVLLKLFYLFKRRLYMEHLLVALHSHAFIFMSVLVILLLTMLAGLAENSPILLELIKWLRVAAWVWLFTYLLLMQKRVYRQGWFMTVLKYCAIGLCYTIFLSFALGVAALVTLAIT